MPARTGPPPGMASRRAARGVAAAVRAVPGGVRPVPGLPGPAGGPGAGRRPERGPGRARAASAAPEAEGEADVLDMMECVMAFVTVDNAADPDCSVMTVNVLDHAGLLRALCWAINGLDLVVEKASLKTVDGMAENVFFLKDTKGNKIEKPDLVAQRVESLLRFCQPTAEEEKAQVHEKNGITIDNRFYPDSTVITCESTVGDRPGSLLNMCSALTAMGCSINEAVVCRDTGDLLPKGGGYTSMLADEPLKSGRTFRFLVQNHEGKKLDYHQAASALFVLDIVAHRLTGPLSDAPRMNNFHN